jgi:hypothetical protein
MMERAPHVVSHHIADAQVGTHVLAVGNRGPRNTVLTAVEHNAVVAEFQSD